MSALNLITLGGGLALFLYGMNMLGGGLEKISSGKMEKILEKLTSNIFLSVLLGAVITAAIQSSSATTVIVVGMVNAGILKLRNAVGVIMGANIGTTVTAQILRLGDLESSSDSLILTLLKPSTLAPLIAIIGILIYMIAKRPRRKVVGEILIGFGILFQGMFTMEEAVSPLKDSPFFYDLFATLQNPVLGVLVGAVVTAIIQSSSASVGILQALSSTGAITYSAAFPIIMGQNIGTCVTSLMASMGANRNAKRAAMVHLYFNIIGTVLFLVAVYGINAAIGGFAFWDTAIDKGGIANVHTLFNVVVTIVFIPFYKQLARLAELTIRKGANERATESDTIELDERFLLMPGLAISKCAEVVEKMISYATQNYLEAITLFGKYDQKAVDRINEREAAIDKMEDRVNNYLVQISENEISDLESKEVTMLLRLVTEFERIGDYAINLMERAEVLYDKQTKFSDRAMEELTIIGAAVEEILQLAADAFIHRDDMIAIKVEPLEETIDTMEDTLKLQHIQRLKSGQCTIDAGLVFLESLTNLERISDHCSNVAVAVIGFNKGSETLNRHEYLSRVHQGDTRSYNDMMRSYMEQYMKILPMDSKNIF